ncbi:hypothetical protein [Limnoglobus roseus]|uniref:Uncharacterized protein n=1 Tax=Limnoglobus roseus TaxID=2598579 RepID=A0A5C1A4R8_9BACT|nr:hypothetical protein [Limnoglobus roseus]QEL13305.1 hypothetical protein PX52LOC_00159 [Limnoglobus roseus]
MTTEELLTAIRERLTGGHGFDDLLARLSQSVALLQDRLASADADERERARIDGAQLQQEIAKLTEFGENRLNGLHTEVTALVRKGSLDRLYGTTHH